MASSGIFFTLFIGIWITAESQNSFANVQCNSENVGLYGHQSLLDCMITLTEEVKSAEVRVVVWRKIGENTDALLSFDKGILKSQPGYSFAEAAWDNTNMNVSLLISNTVGADDGKYLCQVYTDSGNSNTETSLKVKAKYSVPTIQSIPEKITPNEDSTLICQSEGGYPKGELRWFDMDGVEWTASSKMDAKTMKSGLFQLTSELSLLRGSTFSKYSCAVFNATGGKEEATTFEMPPTFDELGVKKHSGQPTKIVAPVVVIGSLIVGLLMVLIYRRRSRGHYRGEVPTREMDADEGDHRKTDQQSQNMII